MSDLEGTELERKAEYVESVFNDAAPDYSPDLSWFAMSAGSDKEQRFVFNTSEYVDSDGIAALRDDGIPIVYIEAYPVEDGVSIDISIPVAEVEP